MENIANIDIQKSASPCNALKKMEEILLAMQHPEKGVPVESQKKNFMSKVPGAFSGTDFLCWLMENLSIENSSEALNLGNFFCQLGYIYQVTEGKNMSLKDDNTMYRFQTPYFWPSLNSQPDHVEYAIYLTKRSLSNKEKYELEEHEQIALTKLQKMLCDKWDFIYMQAQEQIKLLKERKKSDRLVISNQEQAFWRIQRPVPGQGNSFEVDRHSFKPNHTINARKKNIENMKKQVDFLQNCLKLPRTKFSKVIESLINRCQLYHEHDPFLVLPLPSNPWITDDIAMWELEGNITETPTERRVKKWSFCLEEVLRDQAGLHEFELFLEKEFSSENIAFWLSVEGLKGMPKSKVETAAKEIYEEFLAKGAPREINIDSKTMGITVQNLTNPTRLTFEAAQTHIFLLMKKDSYPRFIRSDHYKTLLALAFDPSKQKKFFKFGNKKKQINNSPDLKRRGSAGRSKVPDAAVATSKPISQNAHHSFSTGNLHDLESDISDKDEPFRFDPPSVKKQSDKSAKNSNSSSQSKNPGEKLPKSSSSNDASQPSFHQQQLTLGIAEAAPKSQNVIAPWEEDSFDSIT